VSSDSGTSLKYTQNLSLGFHFINGYANMGHKIALKVQRLSYYLNI